MESVTAVQAKPLSDDFRGFLRSILQPTAPGRLGLLDMREKVRTTARIELRTSVPQVLGTWKVDLPAWTASCRCQLSVPVDDKGTVQAALESGAPAVMLCAGELAPDAWALRQRGLENVAAAIQNPAAPVLWFRPRALGCEEREAVHDEVIPATMLDLAVVYHATKEARRAADKDTSLRPRLGVCLPSVESAFEAAWWDSLLGELESAVAARRGSTHVWVMVDSAPGIAHLDDILSSLRGRVAGASFCLRNYLGSLAEVDRERMVPDLQSARPLLEATLRYMVRVCHKRGVLALGPLTPGKGARGQAPLGLDGARVANPADVAEAVAAFPEPNQLAVVPDAPMSLAAAGPVSTAGTKDAVATLIRVKALEAEGKGCTTSGGGYLDRSAGRLATALLVQRMQRKVKTSDGDEVTPEQVSRWFAEQTLHDAKTRRDAETTLLAHL